MPIIVIDDFYPKPEIIKAKMHSFDFVRLKDVTGWRTSSGYLPKGFKQLLRAKLGFQVYDLEAPQGTPHDNGIFYHAFHKGKKKDVPGVHWDEPLNHHIGIVYLTEGLAEHYGTSFYRHKATGISKTPTRQDAKRVGLPLKELKQKILDDGYFKQRFVETDRVGYRYNRAVVFPANRLHAATAHFGDDLKNGRIYQVFSFDLEKR